LIHFFKSLFFRLRMEEEPLTKRTKVSDQTFDEVLEVFSRGDMSNSLPNIKKEAVDEILPVNLEKKYSHIIVKETVINRKQKNSKSNLQGYISGTSYLKTISLKLDNMVDNLKRKVQIKLLSKDKEISTLNEKIVNLEMREKYDVDFENEVKEVIKLKQAEIIDLKALNDNLNKKFNDGTEKIKHLETQLEVYRNNEENDQLVEENIKLKTELNKKEEQLHCMDNQVNRVKEIVSVSANKIKSFHQKEEHFQKLEDENSRLQELLNVIEIKASDLLKKVETLTQTVEEKEKEILALKDTNRVLEQEISAAFDDKEIEETASSSKERKLLLETSENTNESRCKCKHLAANDGDESIKVEFNRYFNELEKRCKSLSSENDSLKIELSSLRDAHFRNRINEGNQWSTISGSPSHQQNQQQSSKYFQNKTQGVSQYDLAPKYFGKYNFPNDQSSNKRKQVQFSEETMIQSALSNFTADIPVLKGTITFD